jgi:hypothetical protein
VLPPRRKVMATGTNQYPHTGMRLAIPDMRPATTRRHPLVLASASASLVGTVAIMDMAATAVMAVGRVCAYARAKGPLVPCSLQLPWVNSIFRPVRRQIVGPRANRSGLDHTGLLSVASS